MDKTSADFHLHQTYWTKPETLSHADVADFHRLSVSVNWPHRPQDIEMVVDLGQGFFARDRINRPIGAGMWFEYEQDAAMIGMMMTHPKLQAGGLGGEILSAIEKRIAGRRLRLNATAAAYQLYRSVGFADCATVIQYQGTLRLGTPRSLPGLRDVHAADLPAILALDRAVFGASRGHVITMVFERSQTLVLEEAGQVTGFAMCRPFGRGHLIGPLIAETEEAAIALVSTLAQPHDGDFLRLDADARFTGLRDFLNATGLETYDKVVAMTKDTHFGPENADGAVYALASQGLG